MRAIQLAEAIGPDGLIEVDLPDPVPGPNEVLVRVRAASLNFRDLATARGQYPRVNMPPPFVPCSDGAGEVAAVGDDVTRFKVGDKVASSFFQRWLSGGPFEGMHESALGAGGPGMLAEQVVLNEDGLVALPEHLSLEEGACLPCAAVTAWNAVMGGPPARPGETVLVMGTGGVSIFALQFALAAGAEVVAISSSDDKRKRLEEMGARATVNYKTYPEWDVQVKSLTGGKGVDLVVEVGGAGTFARSIQSLRVGGRLNMVGVLTGAHEINPMIIMARVATVRGISVGSRALFEEMNEFMSRHEIRPVIDKAFEFGGAAEAFRHLASGAHFGKVVIRL